MSHDPQAAIYADMPEPRPAVAAPDESRRGPAMGTITLGLAITAVGLKALLHTLAHFDPDPHASTAALLASLGTLLVITSGIGLYRHRGHRRGPG